MQTGRRGWVLLGLLALPLGLLLALRLPLPLSAQGPAAPKDKDKDRPRPAGAAADTPVVERLLAARREYQETLEALRAHYIATGDIERARWAEEELLQFHRIPKQAYVLDLDVPPPTLQALYNIPEANDLYRRALVYKDKGWGNDYVDNQRRAELLFQQLLTRYPQSDKISDAAYQLGDIYEGRAYRQFKRAAAYFERCFQWNTKTQLDARLRAARIYDRQLNDRAEALRLYREIITHETDPRRLEEANRRVAELGGGR
jgi:TolA-binding protein